MPVAVLKKMRAIDNGKAAQKYLRRMNSSPTVPYGNYHADSQFSLR